MRLIDADALIDKFEVELKCAKLSRGEDDLAYKITETATTLFVDEIKETPTIDDISDNAYRLGIDAFKRVMDAKVLGLKFVNANNDISATDKRDMARLIQATENMINDTYNELIEAINGKTNWD